MLLLLCLTYPAMVSGHTPVQIATDPVYLLSGQVSSLLDSTSEMGLADAVAAYSQGQFSQAKPDSMTATNFGLTRSAVWLHMDFDTSANVPHSWLLEIAHASLDSIDVYLAGPDGEYRHQHSGDWQPFSQRPFEHRHHVFPVSLEPDSQYSLYLRVTSQGTLSVPLRFWQPQALWQSDQKNYLLFGLYYGLLLGLLIYNLFLFLSLRNPLYLIYVAFVGCLGIGQAGLSGLNGQFLWTEAAWINHLSPTSGVAAAGIFGTLFVQRFLAGTPRTLGLQWVMPTLSLAYMLTLLCAVLWSYFIAAVAVNLISLVFSASALSLGAVSLYRREPGARFFVLAWVSLLLGMLVIALHNLGILPSNGFTVHALLIGSALEMLLLSLALADRISAMQRAQQHAQAQALEIRQEMVEALRASERQLESRVVERTQELEQANARLQESQSLLQYQANHDTLTGLANRKLLHERLLHLLARCRRQRNGFAMMVADLNGFKAINDRMGHAAGDQVLVEVARRLVSAVRQVDTVARVGGDEFVLLIEGIARREDAERVYSELLNTLEVPVMLDCGAVVHARMSIGMALYPEDGSEPEQLFNLADRAMYAAKLAAREENS